MKSRNIIIVLFLLLSQLAYSQHTSGHVRQSDILERLKNKEENGQLDIFLDTLLQENYSKLLVRNSKNIGIDGFRIRIFSDNGRGAKDQQKRVRANFLSTYSGVDAYSRYEGSYYKIYVGDFRTKNEAYIFLKRIKKNFPDAFIVEDHVNIKE